MKSGFSGALKPDRLGLSSKVNMCSNAGTGDLGVPTTHETLSCRLNSARVNAASTASTSNVRVVVSPVCRFVLNGKSYRPRRATVQTQDEANNFDFPATVSVRWSLVTIKV